MWANIITKKKNARSIAQTNENFSLSLIIKAMLVVLIFSFLPLLAGADYSETSKKCISCHNDTGYPVDTDQDGVAALFVRPHNATVMCEYCHLPDPHVIKFIQPGGTYGNKSTAASCPACHQTGVPNANFTQAFRIPVLLRHSTNSSNGSIWGNYWNNSNPRTACFYCHNNTLHNILPLGRILEWSPGYMAKSTISSGFSCSDCHYKGSANYSNMSISFAAATLPIPPEITNGTGWNGRTRGYFNHTIQDYTDNGCKPCHGNSLATANMSEFLHNVDYADMNNCMSCHRLNGAAPEVIANDLGAHINLNTTIGGSGTLTNEDCSACHYSNPHTGVGMSNTYYCYDCHNKSTGGRAPIRSTKKFDDKRHGAITCINCHVADGRYHQGNPRGSVANLTYVNRNMSTINTLTTECADCHLKANLDDAPFYAPGGGNHIDPSCGNGGGCHGGNTFVVAVHSTTPLDNTNKKPNISVPTLDHSTVTQGTDVIILATVRAANTTNANAFVDGAQYRIMSGIVEAKPWTSMSAVDGDFNGSSDVATAVINTTNIPAGTYNIEVRGMAGGWAQNPLIRYYPMNGDVSPVKSTTLTIQPLGGYINGTIMSGISPLGGALVTASGASNITDPDGKYSLRLSPGIYTVTASKDPTHNSNSMPNIEVREGETTSPGPITLSLKLTGTISGKVTN